MVRGAERDAAVARAAAELGSRPRAFLVDGLTGVGS
jgi:hypothetical protein